MSEEAHVIEDTEATTDNGRSVRVCFDENDAVTIMGLFPPETFRTQRYQRDVKAGAVTVRIYIVIIRRKSGPTQLTLIRDPT